MLGISTLEKEGIEHLSRDEHLTLRNSLSKGPLTSNLTVQRLTNGMLNLFGMNLVSITNFSLT